MFADYMRAAMHKGKYEVLEDGTFFGSIPNCPGVWGNAATLEACRDELEGALDVWLIAGLRHGHVIPVIDGIDLTPPLVPEDIDTTS